VSDGSHTPVLLNEAVDGLNVRANGIYVDGTFGRGGHSREILRRLNAEEGVSILLVEQNAKMALETAHYGYVLEVGRVVMHDTCANLLQSDQVREFYLGMHSESGHGGR